MSDKPEIGTITRKNGIAGQFSLSVPVTYPGEGSNVVEFVGSAYDAPVVMISATGTQTIVSNSSRFGEFSEDWVRRFFTDD